jgi:hypothetical protein
VDDGTCEEGIRKRSVGEVGMVVWEPIEGDGVALGHGVKVENSTGTKA